jgi:RNA polymerase sigma factor (sigma-70 family)
MASVISSAILRTQTDERLVTLARAGHQRAFEAIAERYRGELSRSLRRLLPAASVEDALQQTHLQAWKALSGGTEVRELRAWLHRIARNAAIGVATRGYDYDELQDALLVSPGPEHELERREAVRRALRGIAALPERQREALLAVAVGGRSHAEVALELGITDSAARQLVHRARVSLLAAASIMTPPQLVHWAARAGHSMVAGKAAAGTGVGGTLAGPALKLGAVAATVGGVAAGVGPLGHALVPPAHPVLHHQRHAHHATAPATQTAALKLRPAARPQRAASPAPAAAAAPSAARRHASHHIRRIRTDAVGKAVAPVSAVVPAPSTPASSPAQVSAPAASATPTAVTPTVSPLVALVAWLYAHHQTAASAGVATNGSPGTSSTPTSNSTGSCDGATTATGASDTWHGTPRGCPTRRHFLGSAPAGTAPDPSSP